MVATGYFDTPNLMDVPGEDLPKVTHYFREPHPYFDQDVVVVGGGNSAIDAALSCWRAGARVTLVHRFAGLDPGVKPWVLPDIRNRIDAGQIRALWNRRLMAIEPGRVQIARAAEGDVPAGRGSPGPEGEGIPNDFVLAMTGFRPDPWILRSLGARVDPGTGVPEITLSLLVVVPLPIPVAGWSRLWMPQVQ